MKNSLPALSLIALVALVGCRHGVNPNGPVAPMTLLTPQTKVPPPATGSYSIPGGYYQGQASNSTPATNTYASNSAANNVEQPIGSGVAQVAAATPAQPASLPAWTDYSPRYAEVQPAAYTSSPNSGPITGGPITGGPTTSSMQSPADAGLRPQLRGMEVVDLTRSDKPATAPQSTPENDLQPAMRTNSSSLPWRDPIQ